LQIIPGVGPEGSRHLKLANINTESELIDLFISLKGSGMTNQEHCDAMYQWLADHSINSHRHEIIQAVSEKLDHVYTPAKKVSTSTNVAENGSASVADENGTDFNWGGIMILMLAIIAALYFNGLLDTV
jgi:hypothetical protein